jgi:plasmid maintenance system antidote protein VapI
MRIEKRKCFFNLVGAGFKNVEELAKATGIHRATLNPYINGRKSIYTNVIERISEALQFNPQEISENETDLQKKVANDG